MKAFLIVVFSFIALLILLFIVPFFLPASGIRTGIEKRINLFVDGKVSISSVHFRILPYPGFVAHDLLVISDHPEFKGRPVIKADALKGSFSPFAFMKGKMVTDLVVTGAEVNYRSTPNGGTIEFNENGLEQMELRTLSVKGGTFSYTREDAEEPIYFEQVDLNLASARLELSALAKGGVEKPFSMVCNISLDNQNHLLEISDVDLLWGEMRLSAGAVLQYAAVPRSFDLTIASAEADTETLFKIVPSFVNKLLAKVDASGFSAFNLTLNGTKEKISVKLHTDLTRSKIAVGHFFSKETNLPLKVVFEGSYEPDRLSVEGMTLSLDESSFLVKGVIFDQPAFPVDMEIEQGKTTDKFNIASVIPVMDMADSISLPGLKVKLKGSLFDSKGLAIDGQLRSVSAKFFGYDLSNLELYFNYKDNKLLLVPFKAMAYDGSLTGNGQLILGDIPELSLKLVIDNISASSLNFSKSVIEGKGSLVMDMKGKGKDSSEIKESLVSEGTFVVPKGKFSGLYFAKAILTDDLVNTINPYISGGLNAGVLNQIRGADETFEGLKISFATSGDALTVSKMGWGTGNYNARFSGSINPQLLVVGEGGLLLSEAVTRGLIKDPVSRRKVAGNDDIFEVPVLVSGLMTSLLLSPDKEALLGDVGAEEVKKPEAAKKPPKKTVKSNVQEKENGEEKMTTDIDEDVFKVMIGE